MKFYVNFLGGFVFLVFYLIFFFGSLYRGKNGHASAAKLQKYNLSVPACRKKFDYLLVLDTRYNHYKTPGILQ